MPFIHPASWWYSGIFFINANNRALAGKHEERKMRHAARLLTAMMIWGESFLRKRGNARRDERRYVLPGDVKEGWKVFTLKKCNLCHSILGEGGKGGPDLGTAPGSFVSPAQLTALLWNHGPEMWTRMSAKKVPLPGMTTKEMTDLFGFLYFLRYMEEPGDPTRGRSLLEAGACGKCHRVKGTQKDDLSRWECTSIPSSGRR